MSNYIKYPVKQLKTILRKKPNELKPRPKLIPFQRFIKRSYFLLNKFKISYFPPIEKNTVKKRNVINHIMIMNKNIKGDHSPDFREKLLYAGQ
jgi:hypothetical protein